MNVLLPELLTGFIAEAQSYVSRLREALTGSDEGAASANQDTVRQLAGILADSAEMLELATIAELARTIADRADALEGDDNAELIEILDQIDADLVAQTAAAEAAASEPAQADSPATSSDPATRSAPSVIGMLPGGDLVPADLPPELLEIFSIEAQEHTGAIQSLLDHLRSQPGDPEALRDIRRAAHTLKGAAASVGFTFMSHIAHLMEEVLEQRIEAEEPLTEAELALQYESLDMLVDLLEPEENAALRVTLESLAQRYGALLGEAYPAPPGWVPPEPGESSGPAPSGQTPGDAGTTTSAPRMENMLRISLENMDDLINRVGEIIINRSGLERHLSGLHGLLNELERATKRLRQVVISVDNQVEATLPVKASQRQDGDSTFDPLEMDRYTLLYQFMRELEEVAADTGDINSQLHFLAGDLEAGLTRERRLTTELQDGLMSTRLVPFYELETRIRRIVRRTARDVGKKVDVVLTGFATTVDKAILDTLADPLMHLLRNAVDHGIEDSAARRAAGKPADGMVTLDVSRERGRVVLTLTDDGGGIDIEAVRQHAVSAGLIAGDDKLNSQQILNLLFEEGFSLAEIVTQTSGRGVGLDIVRRAINRLQGTIRIDTMPGQGATFTLSVPITLAIAQALFIQCGGQEYAVPLDQVAVVLRLEDDFMEQIQKEGVLRYEGEPLAVYDLNKFVGDPSRPTAELRYGLITETNDQPQVVLIERVLGIREAVVKSLGTHLRRVPGIVGATIAGDGRVTLILDLVEITMLESATFDDDAPAHPVAAPRTREMPHVLVVDDSPSVRRVVCAFLERVGWQTTSAKDGLEALEQLGSIRPDVALVDIEMPRMNGFELLARIKSDPGLKSIPVVFLTSRSAAKHRERAMQLQVDGYLVKPYREEDLLAELKGVMRKRG